jgi:hypothetical protein
MLVLSGNGEEGRYEIQHCNFVLHRLNDFSVCGGADLDRDGKLDSDDMKYMQAAMSCEA